MSINPESIKPKVHGFSDFFSWNLYRYLKKYNNQRIYLAPFDYFHGVKGPMVLVVGEERDGRWIHGGRLRSLCNGVWKSPPNRFAYPNTKYWADITDEFFADYLKRGVCAIHGDTAHKWIDNGDNRVCEYCAKKQVKVIKIVETADWVDCTQESK